MIPFIAYLVWMFINAAVLNVAVKTGWGYDPGYVGPFLIVLVTNMTLLLYNAQKRTNT